MHVYLIKQIHISWHHSENCVVWRYYEAGIKLKIHCDPKEIIKQSGLYL